MDTIAALLCLILTIVAGLFEASRLREALATGILPSRGSAYELVREPVAFWCAFAFESACLLALAILGAWSVIRLVSVGINSLTDPVLVLS